MATSRDYKRSRSRRESFSGWTGLLLGFVAGLTVGLGFYFLDPRTPPQSAADPPAEPEPASAREPAEEDSGEQYDYYNMLPNFEVVVPERETGIAPDLPIAPEQNGAYVLQAGSYKRFEDADRVRAQLALQGIESQVQRVSIDNNTWHRVRVGPITDLAELNRVKQRLAEADIDVLVVRVGD